MDTLIASPHTLSHARQARAASSGTAAVARLALSLSVANARSLEALSAWVRWLHHHAVQSRAQLVLTQGCVVAAHARVDVLCRDHAALREVVTAHDTMLRDHAQRLTALEQRAAAALSTLHMLLRYAGGAGCVLLAWALYSLTLKLTQLLRLYRLLPRTAQRLLNTYTRLFKWMAIATTAAALWRQLASSHRSILTQP